MKRAVNLHIGVSIAATVLLVLCGQAHGQSYTETGPGTRTQYDALGRVLQVDADSEIGILTSRNEYLDGFQTRTTNPRGNQTTQTFWALNDPQAALIHTISAPENVSVSIQRDAFGKPTSITRGGNGKSVTRSYVYEPGQRLCKTVEPEVGATVQTYDAAGNINWRAPGQTFVSTSPGACNDGDVQPAGKITYAYDERNQLNTASYGDGSAGIARTYWPDGLPKTIASNGSLWTYSYNELRLPTTEVFSYSDVAYTIERGYNTAGNLSTLTYPAGNSASLVLAYRPNALGEPTAVGGYASDVSFHPNGAVASYTLGNGIGHQLTLNARGLPERNIDVGIMQDAYTYDENANVKSITDEQEAIFNRSMDLYDGLDRLRTASAPNVWGSATYEYDTLDNITRADVGTRTTGLQYDGSNRLSDITVSGSALHYTYDVNGNIHTKGAQSYTFDLGNRMNSSSLGGAYAYDGLGRRFKSVVAGETRFTLYGQAGQLLWSVRPGSDTSYVYLAGKQIAELTNSVSSGGVRGGSSVVSRLQYVHTDALGSPVAHTDSSASHTLLNRSRFEPYGYVAQGAKPGVGTSIVGFTGHVQDAETDLVYMQQRYYDPIAGRFLSVDPVVTDANTGKGFGLYTYVGNNPYAKIDPDGMEEKTIDGKKYESRTQENPKDLKGHDLFLNSKGEAQCVELVKQTVGGNQSAETWRAGEPVTKDTPAGTAVGNFNKDGTFDKQDTGQHAAILTEPTKKDGSIKVVDQWKQMKDEGKKVQERTILKESRTNPTPSNNAKDFRVILFEKKD